MKRKINESFYPSAENFLASYHNSTVQEVIQAIQENDIVVVGMAQNLVVKRAKKALQKENIEFKYLEYGSYFSAWRPRLMIKIWSGWPTFPQIFIHGKLLGGADDLIACMEDGSFQKLLSKGEDNE